MTHTATCSDARSEERHGRGPILIAAAVTAFAMVLAGCNTTEGAGQDIQEAGSGIEDAAD